jgi:hypothetical protein
MASVSSLTPVYRVGGWLQCGDPDEGAAVLVDVQVVNQVVGRCEPAGTSSDLTS